MATRPRTEQSAFEDVHAEVFKDLSARVVFSDQDLAGFDPLTASDQELRAHALPPRPDAKRLPIALANWERLMSKPLDFVKPLPFEEFFTISKVVRHQVLLALKQSFDGETSGNWSGAVVRGPDDGLCTLVQGTWTVPAPKPPPEAQSGTSWVDGSWVSSAWVGLDGHNPASVSMPQMGTQQTVTVQSGTVTFASVAWWQWWLRDQAWSVQLNLPLPVLNGQEVSVLLTVISLKHVNFFIKNLASGVAISFDVSAPALPGSAPEPLEGQTAEWILERQTEPGGTDLLPFNNYKKCEFTGCSAVIEDAAGVPADADLMDAGLIRMVDWTDPANPGRVVSVPNTVTVPDELEVSYVVGVP